MSVYCKVKLAKRKVETRDRKIVELLSELNKSNTKVGELRCELEQELEKLFGLTEAFGKEK